MKLKIAIISLLLLTGFVANAHDFTATVDGQLLHFEITNKSKRTAAVTYGGSISEKKVNNISGKIEIPSKVNHENVVYQVTAIGPKAFAGAKRLRGVVIPMGVEMIGDFAFEGCDSLSSIVFPGNPITFGQGVFFKCTSISDVTIGSDWKAIDFSMFRWSDSLTNINIPAKVEKIQGVKKLKNLSRISVDSNNEKFASCDGLLYSKNGKTLYACPRAYADRVTIKEGTEQVIAGALIDCVEVAYIDFPSSLKSLSFRETSRMKRLETVVMRPLKPINTAYLKGEGKFLLQIANSKVEIVILSSAKKDYEGSMANEPGEYSESVSGIPFMVTTQQMPTKKNIKGVKNFDRY